MKKLRYILFPFSLLYALVTEVRNFLFDKSIFSSKSYDIPIINVGNIRLGGTGKTPMIEYLIRLLQNDYKIVVISRGYKRKTKGVVVATNKTTPQQIGDEPFQIYQKFSKVQVIVSEKRVEGIELALSQINPDVILLDDAYQHRWVNAGYNIMLTAYNQLFTSDYILPTGNLRECRHNVKRADCVIVTKTPENIETKEQQSIINQIHRYYNSDIYFSSIKYRNKIISETNTIDIQDLSNYEILLVTGIAVVQPLLSFLSEKNSNFVGLHFGDHHHFTSRDIVKIKSKYANLNSSNKLILTTEKDYVRLQNLIKNVYYLPIEATIKESKEFNNKILDYVRKK